MDFICLVKKSKMSFKGFCTEMSRHCQTNAMNSMKFMSPSTFVKWFFAWISTFQIDFRKEIDPWCEHSPRILACDGTHIGVATRKMNLAQPVTSADDIDCTSITKHKQYDRVFVADTNARLHLNYMCRKILKKLKPKEKLFEEKELCETQYTMNEVRRIGDDILTQIVTTLIEQRLHKEVIRTLAKFFLMFCKDAAWSSVLHPSSAIHLCTCW